MSNFKLLVVFLLLFFLSLSHTFASWMVKQRVSENGVVKIDSVQSCEVALSDQSQLVLRSLPEFIVEGPGEEIPSYYQEIVYQEGALPRVYQHFLQTHSRINNEDESWPGSEVRSLVNQGPVGNRIDLTFVGDGYTLEEKEKFFSDVQRMTNDLFQGSTFASYLPLFNVHAVFVPSSESGISDVEEKNTALGLYRSPKGSKRAVMPGDNMAIERALRLAPEADFPILIANDDFYGGLGGRYAITTRSLDSGSMVLRHELGHNFGDVGEEYEGGQSYFGANASRTSNVPWKHWVQGSQTPVYEPRHLSGVYVWKNLQGSPYKIRFNFPGPSGGVPYRFDAQFSSVGWRTSEDVRVSIDGEQHPIKGVFTKDRSFHELENPPSLESGQHELVVEESIQDGDNVLAFAQLYALPININTDHHHVGAYATFDQNGSRSYRPTFDTCLMRNMRSPDFCHVDKENMWIRFLSRVKLIDQIEKTTSGTEQTLTVHTPKLQGLSFEWTKVGREEEIIGSGPSITLPISEHGRYRVKVRFETAEVQKPGVEFKDQREIEI